MRSQCPGEIAMIERNLRGDRVPGRRGTDGNIAELVRPYTDAQLGLTRALNQLRGVDNRRRLGHNRGSGRSGIRRLCGVSSVAGKYWRGLQRSDDGRALRVVDGSAGVAREVRLRLRRILPLRGVPSLALVAGL